MSDCESASGIPIFEVQNFKQKSVYLTVKIFDISITLVCFENNIKDYNIICDNIPM